MQEKREKEFKALWDSNHWLRAQTSTNHTFTISICNQDKKDIFAKRNKHKFPKDKWENYHNLIVMLTEPQLPRKHVLQYIQRWRAQIPIHHSEALVIQGQHYSIGHLFNKKITPNPKIKNQLPYKKSQHRKPKQLLFHFSGNFESSHISPNRPPLPKTDLRRV